MQPKTPMEYSCTELNYLINNVCFGNEADAMSLIKSLRTEILSLGICCDPTSQSFVSIEDISSRKHKLVGSSGLLGLFSLSKYLREIVFLDGQFEYNYYTFVASIRAIISYLDELMLHLGKGKSYRCTCHIE